MASPIRRSSRRSGSGSRRCGDAVTRAPELPGGPEPVSHEEQVAGHIEGQQALLPWRHLGVDHRALTGGSDHPEIYLVARPPPDRTHPDPVPVDHAEPLRPDTAKVPHRTRQTPPHAAPPPLHA